MQSREVTDALAKRDMAELVKDLNRLAMDVSKNDEKYYIIFATKNDVDMVKKIVYGFAALILTGFGAAIVNFFIGRR